MTHDSYGAHLADMRPGSSNSSLTSSLSGAIGESMAPHSRHSHSPPIRSDSLYASEWAAAPQPAQISLGIQHQPPYPGVAGMGNIPYATHDLPGGMSYTTNRNPSPDSNSSGSTFCNPTNAMFGANQYSLHRNHASLSSRRDGTSFPLGPPQLHPSSSSNEERLKNEIVQLRRRVQDLEATERARINTDPGASDTIATSGLGGLPTPPPSASFVASWKVRTETRRRMFCSLNRAGNALCAWHDSRRERREFPPRNAPPGYLNCGCTHEEALFEESLARHNVGSYYPGENVRMDPALRNPLLKLLQLRYGYQDGDFERNSITGDWVEGEGAAYWEQQAHSGSSSRRRLDIGH
ncbi:hypothetical protein DXG03_007662 [Asterophora parasitica]|uniref:Uncharacterized protein n=1 Tax=Asterophora parasitica TaxID=117018 RepID=A0A9P7K834_9AGAR|nr:hypothetical protein DXG03_007662 [Asterophora parasitica]